MAPQAQTIPTPPPSKYMAKDFFTYVINIGTLAAAASLPGSVTMDADSDFLWQKAAYFVDTAGISQQAATREIPLETITIKDTGSGRDLMNAAVPLPAIFGEGDLPFILPTPKVFPARATIAVTVANFSAATEYTNTRLVFIGTKLFLR